MMTLEEAIRHWEEKVDCTECGKEHKQLALWLKELVCFRKAKEEYFKEFIRFMSSDEFTNTNTKAATGKLWIGQERK